MERPCQSQYFPGDSDASDGESPIPDEYVQRNKKYPIDSWPNPSGFAGGFGSEAFRTSNESPLRPELSVLEFQINQRILSWDSHIPPPKNSSPTDEPSSRSASTESKPTHRAVPSPPQSQATSHSHAWKTPIYRPSRFGSIEDEDKDEENLDYMPRGTWNKRPITMPKLTPSPDTNSQSTSSEGPNKPSVKHLTCWWWYEKGHCRYTESECLYAHRDTGLVADAPRQIKPGEPALAGRSLNRALRQAQQGSAGQGEKGKGPVECQTSIVKTLQEENAALRMAYELLLPTTLQFLEATTHLRRSLNKLQHHMKDAMANTPAEYMDSVNEANMRAMERFSLDSRPFRPEKYPEKAPFPKSEPFEPVYSLPVDETNSRMKEIEQRSLHVGAAEWEARVKVANIENILTEAGMEYLAESTREKATQKKQ